MIDIGDEIAIKANFLEVTDEGYLFSLSEIPYDEPFIIKLSKTDQAYNESVHNALDRLKIQSQ